MSRISQAGQPSATDRLMPGSSYTRDAGFGGEPVSYRAICVTYAGIRQRWRVVHTHAARQRRVFQSFIDISVLHVSSLKTFVVGLTAAQKALLTRLGDRYVALYAKSG